MTNTINTINTTMTTTYYSPRYKETFTVISKDVQPHWACARFAKVRVEIGHWNFSGENFIHRGLGDGMDYAQAFALAVRDVESEDEVMNEDEMMLHGCD